MKKDASDNARTAFTLIELLTVLAVMGILMALLMPAISTGRERGRRAYCQNNLGQVGKALMLFAEDNRDYLPPVGSGNDSVWDLAILPYMGFATNIFICPSDPHLVAASTNEAPRSYACNGTSAESPFGAPGGRGLRTSDLEYNKGDLILVGEWPGTDTSSRGFVGKFSFCHLDSADDSCGRIHDKNRGGNYLMASMSVQYLKRDDELLVKDSGFGNLWQRYTGAVTP